MDCPPPHSIVSNSVLLHIYLQQCINSLIVTNCNNSLIVTMMLNPLISAIFDYLKNHHRNLKIYHVDQCDLHCFPLQKWGCVWLSSSLTLWETVSADESWSLSHLSLSPCCLSVCILSSFLTWQPSIHRYIYVHNITKSHHFRPVFVWLQWNVRGVMSCYAIFLTTECINHK